MRTDRRAGIAHISFPKEPGATQAKRLLWVAACSRSQPSPALSVGRAPVPELDTAPQPLKRMQRGHRPGRSRGGGSERPRLPTTVLDALQPLLSPPATPTLAPWPPVAACPSSLFLSPQFSSWDSEEQIPLARPPPHELPGLRARAGRSRPAHRGHPGGKLYPDPQP